jgi:hypothetical protein
MIDEIKFKVRAYGYGELAQLYFPNIGKKSASWQLTIWINENQALRQSLIDSGRTAGQKLLNPTQVAMIVGEFGEP